MAVDIKYNGGITIIDPNPNGTNINHEDLMVYVRLLARTKSRSILQNEDDQIVQLEQELKNVPSQTNYTYPAGSKALTTDWTQIGGTKLNGKDVGGFGITSIDIDIKSSFQPQVTIDFVDIRGATLFEQGPCSPYAAFFHMPYPVFELTIKGFYGRPVTYTLALRKFNTKFNPSTGNFEVKAEFLGYTYAFLADLVMGYALAAPYMPGADDKLNSIWRNILQSREASEYENKFLYKSQDETENKLPETAVTLKQMLEDINTLEKTLGELANAEEFQDISRLNILKTEANKLSDIVNDFQNDVRGLNIDVEYLNSDYDKGGKTKLKIVQKDLDNKQIQELKQLVKNYFGSNNSGKNTDGTTKGQGIYEASLGVLNAIEVRKSYDIKELPKVYDSIVQKGLYVKDTTLKEENGEKYYFIDLGKSFKESLNIFKAEVDEKLEKHNEKVVDLINQAVKKVLGYVPTVQNVMTIIIANMELFLQLLVDASWKAEEVHDNEKIVSKKLLGDGMVDDKVYPWPTYFVKDDTKGGDVERYPGLEATFNNWEEVKFVEDYIKAYLELKEDLELITGEVEGKPGFDNFIPLNPMESSLMDSFGIKPISYWRDKQLPTVYQNVGERAFLVGDYTMLNGLSGWRSRFGLTNIPGNAPNTVLSTDISNRSTYRPWSRLVDDKLMRKYGYLDGINAVNSIVETLTLTKLQNQITNDPASFKQSVLTQLSGNSGNLTKQTFNEWANSDPTGVTPSQIETTLKNLDSSYFSDISSTNVYTYSSNIVVGEANNSVPIGPNPHEHKTFVILDSEPTRKISLEGKILNNGSESKTSPFVYNSDGNGYTKGLVYEKSILETNDTTNSFFKLNETTRVPSTNDTFKDKFLELGPWADDNYTDDKINYDFGSINWIDSLDTGGEFGEPWSSIDSEYYDALIQTPLWAKNLPTSKHYKRAQDTTYYNTDQFGLHSDTNLSYKALGYLALITLGWSDKDRGYAGWYDTNGLLFRTASTFFKITGGQVKVPKGFSLITGAVLWRLREAGYLTGGDTNASTTEGLLSKNGGVDPIYWWEGGGLTTMTLNGGFGYPIYVNNTPGLKGFKKLEPYHWPHVYDPSSGVVQALSMTLIENNVEQKWSDNRTSPAGDSSYEYVDIRVHMKTLMLLPNDIKEAFIKRFEDWALGVWKDKYIKSFDPLTFGGATNIFDYYSSAGTFRRVGPKNGLGDDSKNNEAINEMYTEMYETYDILGFSTPKAFNAITKNDFRNTFNLREKELDSFLDGWIEGFQSAVNDKITEKQNGADSDELSGKNALDDPDIKLNLYRSFKSIFDKWISRSKKGLNGYNLFYNEVSNNPDKSRLLIDHFKFVDRGFNQVGHKAVVDVTLLKSMAENPTTSLYQTIAEFVSKNNFDFFPLPSFIPYGNDKVSQDALKDMFEPITTLDNIEASPSFICMYIGGTSKNLDLGPSKQSFCSDNNEILYRYEDDGIRDLGNTDSKNLVEGNVTAFLVSYGIENQSHFKSVSLNQAEFKETQESLMVIDQLAKGGNENNRTAKGQNLYNIYQTRSYTCEVECMGNVQIQPMMYFQLTNVPMFHGSYLITDVKHNIKPHFVTTTFKGTRVPKVVVPIVTEAYSTMVLGQTDPKKSAGPGQAIIDNIKGKNNTSQGSEQGELNISSSSDPSTLIKIDTAPPKESPTLSQIIDVMKKKKGVFNSRKAYTDYHKGSVLFKDVKDKLISDGIYEPNKPYVIEEEPFVVNVVGIRSFSQKANSYDDFMTVFYVDPNGKESYGGKKWTFKSWSITTEPGSTILNAPDNNLGAAIVAEGQYTHSHNIGLHHSSYNTLHNGNPILVYRDNDRDKWAQKSTDNLTVYIPYTNIHCSGAQDKGGTADINTWSAGCQVFRRASDYMDFIYTTHIIAKNETKSGTQSFKLDNNGGCGVCKKTLRDFIPEELKSSMSGSVPVRRFTYTLLNTADFGNPNIAAGNDVYENYINSGVHTA